MGRGLQKDIRLAILFQSTFSFSSSCIWQNTQIAFSLQFLVLMASNKPTSHHPMKTFHALGLFITLVLVKGAAAAQFKVGGASGWTVPADGNNALNQWAESNRFQIGDSLLFSYQPDKDSVLKVDKDGYDNCKVDSGTPSKDGNTVFTLDKSGPQFFISGVKDNCLKNEKLVVVVMANRSGTSGKVSAAPPPLVPPFLSPPPPGLSPSNGTVPGSPLSPSNSTVFGSPPPPAAGSPESPPIAPSGVESPPPPTGNGASSKFISFIACVGVIGSSLLFIL